MNDPSNLQRFVVAQAPLYERVVAEGRQSWPQRDGPAVAISSFEEAYFSHDVLGPRLGRMHRLDQQRPVRIDDRIPGAAGRSEIAVVDYVVRGGFR